MTIRESGVDSVTIGKGEMEVSERERASARRPDGAHRAPSPSHPRCHVIPAKAGTYWRRRARIAPRLQAIPGASSFPRKREPTGGRPLMRKAGTYSTALRPHPQYPLPPRSRRSLP